MLLQVIGGFGLLALIFVPLEHLFALHRQPIIRSGWWTDAVYYFTGYFIGRGGNALLTLTVTTLVLQQTLSSPAWITAQPIGLQLIEAILIADLGYYIAHRLLHTVPWLWKFHAIHHSAETLDWLAAVRVHPLDQLFTKVFQWLPLILLGFSQEALAAYVLFSAAIAFFIHANLKFRYGFLKWIIVTPELHHWHHCDDPQAYNKNFAAQLPLLDWLLGSLYLPAHKKPTHYGVPEAVPSNYLKQLLYPLQRKASHV